MISSEWRKSVIVAIPKKRRSGAYLRSGSEVQALAN